MKILFRPVMSLFFACLVISNVAWAFERPVIINDEKIQHISDGVDYLRINMWRERDIDVHLLRINYQNSQIQLKPALLGEYLAGSIETLLSLNHKVSLLCGISYGSFQNYSDIVPAGEILSQLVLDGEVISTVNPIHSSHNAVLSISKDDNMVIKKPISPKIDFAIGQSASIHDVWINPLEGLHGDKVLIYTDKVGIKIPAVKNTKKYICFFDNEKKLMANQEISLKGIATSEKNTIETVKNGLVIVPLGKYENIFNQLVTTDSILKLKIGYPDKLEETKHMIGGPALLVKDRHNLLRDTNMSLTKKSFAGIDSKGNLYLVAINKSTWHEAALIALELNIDTALMLGSGESVDLIIQGATVFDSKMPASAAFIASSKGDK